MFRQDLDLDIALILPMLKDSGIGVPDEDKDVIFNQFIRGSNAIGDESGTGVGLFHSKKSALEMGGR